MIKVTFEFVTIEQAIATLGKIMQKSTVEAPVAPKANSATGGDPAAASDPVAPTTQRKGRADKGKARGPHKNAKPEESSQTAVTAEQPLTPPGEAPETAAPAAPAEGDKPQPSGVVPPVAAVPSQDEAQKVLEALFAAKGLPAAQEVMSRFGVKRLRDLKPEQRAEFMQLATEEAAK